ncbi:MAG: hypothetical protein HYX68_01015 [Planctomycetes bacterium]|nr:hypothetical protein [Planctomycetota bacterium]
MTIDRSDDTPGADASARENAWSRFWFTATPLTGLRFLRVCAGVLFCAWLLSFLGHQAEFFSLNGWLDEQGYREIQRQQPLGPAPVGWSIVFLAGQNEGAFQTIYGLSVAVVILFTLGIATRVTGVLTWVVVVSFLVNPVINYEGDYLLGVLAFYLMLGHLLTGQVNGGLTLAERILGSRHDFLLARWVFGGAAENGRVSYATNFSLRLLQVHFAIIMVTSVLHKLQMAEWWSGVAFWFPLHPPFETTAESIQREMPRATFTLFWMSVTQYVALAWQLAFPVFAWRRGWAWRSLLLGGAVVFWLGAFFLYRLPLWGPFVCLGCVSFLSADEWAWIKSRLLGVISRVANQKNDAGAMKSRDLAETTAIRK